MTLHISYLRSDNENPRFSDDPYCWCAFFAVSLVRSTAMVTERRFALRASCLENDDAFTLEDSWLVISSCYNLDSSG